MSNITVEEKMLMTLPQSGGDPETVKLTLETNGKVSKAGVREGEFFYPKMKKIVNIIDSVFENRAGNAGKKGMIKLSVSLPAGEEFWYPYVTSNEPSAVPLECIEYVHFKDDKTLELTFLEPDPNQSFLESLMFYTDKGPIDPGVSVRRGVGQ